MSSTPGYRRSPVVIPIISVAVGDCLRVTTIAELPAGGPDEELATLATDAGLMHVAVENERGGQLLTARI